MQCYLDTNLLFLIKTALYRNCSDLNVTLYHGGLKNNTFG